MFCPNCKDEFRAGFTRCEGCGVDLVEDLSNVPAGPAPTTAPPPAGPLRIADYCGFFSLDEARASREVLRGSGIRCEIAIRDAPTSPGEEAPEAREVREEYWLRIETDRLKEAAAILDDEDEAEP